MSDPRIYSPQERGNSDRPWRVCVGNCGANFSTQHDAEEAFRIATAAIEVGRSEKAREIRLALGVRS